jgi:hypothetical protein
MAPENKVIYAGGRNYIEELLSSSVSGYEELKMYALTAKR